MCPWLLVATWWSRSLHLAPLPQCWSNWSASSEWVSGSSICKTIILHTYSSAKYRSRTAVCYCAPLAFVVAVNCWSVTMASRTQITLTFIKVFALVLIIIPGVIALAKGVCVCSYYLCRDWYVYKWQSFVVLVSPFMQERQKISRMVLRLMQ